MKPGDPVKYHPWTGTLIHIHADKAWVHWSGMVDTQRIVNAHSLVDANLLEENK